MSTPDHADNNQTTASEKEARRLEELRAFGVLDTPPEPEFDDLVALASEICQTPIALVSLVDESRQWFKSAVGLTVKQTPREIAFCAHALENRDLLLVADATQDRRFAGNPLVTGEPHIRFYAGAPLVTPEGHALGTLCVIDRVPRRLTERQQQALKVLSRQVVMEMMLRRQLREREKTEQALRQSELEQRELVRRLVEAQAVAKVGSWETDLATLAVRWSEQTHRIFETDPTAFSPTHAAFLACVHPEDRAGVERAFMQSQGRREVQVMGHRLLLPDGRIKFVEERWRVYFDAADRPVRATGTCRDITEQKKAEAERDRMFNLSLDMLCVAGFDGRLQQVNPAWTECLGWTAEELTSRPMLEFVHPDDRAATLQSRAQIYQGNRSRGFVNRYRCKDGSYRRFSWNVHPLPELQQVFGVARDVTEERRAEERTREQAALLDKAQDAILVCDLDHRITYWNKSAARLYGWSAPEAVGRSVRELLYFDAGIYDQAMAQLLAQGEWSGEILHRRKDGEKLSIEGRWTLVRDEAGHPKTVLAINTDITERKKLEQQFLRAQRMESIGTLAGGIAHDLNNLLAPITMGVDLLKLFQPNPKSLPVIENIERSARRGTELVKQVLSFARGVEGARVTLQVRHILKEVESIAHNTFPKNIRVETDLPRTLWPVVADPTQLNQVVMNLCVNARDALPEGGRIELKADNVEVDEPYAVMNGRVAPGRYVAIQVIDNGTGIPKAILDRIFEPFFTTKELGRGTGLGLSTALGIVRSHGGFINVCSEVGKGSTFKVYLPAQADAEPAGRLETEPGRLPRGAGEWILVVDDETSVLDITKQTLSAFGYQVMTAEDGAQAISLYALHREKIAVVLTDMMMPVMDGSTLIIALRRINAQVRVVAASGLNANAHVARAAGSGVKHFLAKPYTADALLVMLKTVLYENSSRPPV